MLKPNGEIFSACRRTLGERTWGRVLAAMETISSAESLPDVLEHLRVSFELPGYIADLARLEEVIYEKSKQYGTLQPPLDTTVVNPTLTLVPIQWKHLTTLIQSHKQGIEPVQEHNHAMIWCHPQSGRTMVREAEPIDLLALKLTVDGVDPRTAAEIGKVTVGEIQSAIDRGVDQGLLISSASRIRRRQKIPVSETLAPFLSSDVFTLQWHVTQTCDLHCKHCYDRSERSPLTLDTAMGILDDFYSFCGHMHVRGQISFTGGNPLLYPHFDTVYRSAANYGFGIAILGNPAPKRRIREILTIAPPLFYQISLEGLQAHNDQIRGEGHFKRSLAFLDELRTLRIYAMVMLTLTRNNIGQVLPLAEMLRTRADFFTFNRLSTVGEGASLLMPDQSVFRAFLNDYHSAAAENPILGLKDNLINIILAEKGLPPFGGCTGHGCGAAFNFLALLPDGEVHACRKFPSLLGSVPASSFHDIYHSELAQRYRSGAAACRQCTLNTVCRGCLATAYSLKQDIFLHEDPFCFAPPQVTGEDMQTELST